LPYLRFTSVLLASGIAKYKDFQHVENPLKLFPENLKDPFKFVLHNFKKIKFANRKFILYI